MALNYAIVLFIACIRNLLFHLLFIDSFVQLSVQHGHPFHLAARHDIC